jgi:hypothetical protein
VSVETPEEEAAMEKAMDFTPAPFTSFHMCAACASDPPRPAGQLSRQYKDLAHAVNPGLAAQMARNQQGAGGYD